MSNSRKLRDDIIYSLVRWAIFAVALALLPILMRGLGSFTRGEGVGFTELFEEGELLLVSAAIVGAALADLVTESGSKLRIRRLTSGGFAGLVGITAAAWFADIAAGRRDGSNLDPHNIAIGSVVIFGFAVVAGVSCIVLAGLTRKR